MGRGCGDGDAGTRIWGRGKLGRLGTRDRGRVGTRNRGRRDVSLGTRGHEIGDLPLCPYRVSHDDQGLKSLLDTIS